MLAEFGHLPAPSQRRLLALARSTADPSVDAAEHAALMSWCVEEARRTLPCADVEREFAFGRKWLTTPGAPERLLRATSN